MNDPEVLASFYSKLTGWTVQRSNDQTSPYIDLEARRATTLGATLVKRFAEGDEGWIWMTDPEGNEFCFCNSC